MNQEVIHQTARHLYGKHHNVDCASQNKFVVIFYQYYLLYVNVDKTLHHHAEKGQ